MIQPLLQRIFGQDKISVGHEFLWNFLGFTVASLSGIIINIVIARLYGTSVLGAFNQILILFLFFSQIAVGGFHFSTLALIGRVSPDQRSTSLISALLITAPLSSFVAVGVYFSAFWIGGTLLQSQMVEEGLRLMAPAVAVAGINKVFLAALNGARFLREFSVFSAARFLFLAVGISLSALNDVSPQMLPAALLYSEIISALGLMGTIWLRFGHRINNPWPMINKHFQHGSLTFINGFLLDINTRIDVLILGIFVSDAMVGIYSFAALMADGFFQMISITQIVVNPILSGLLLNSDYMKIKTIVNKSLKWLMPLSALVGGIMIILYLPFAKLVTGHSGFSKGLPVLVVLILGIISTSGYLPISWIMNQAGRPGWFSIQVTLLTLSNILLNFILIPFFGILGAAFATAFSMLLLVPWIKIACKRILFIEV